MNPYVKSAQPRDDYCLLLTFENGEKRVFDVKPYFDKPVFAGLKNIALFKTARVVSGSVEWQGEIDLSYDTLYLESKTIKEAQPQRKPKRGQKKTRNAAMAAVRGKKLPKARVVSK
jgi:hypothetical protein